MVRVLSYISLSTVPSAFFFVVQLLVTELENRSELEISPLFLITITLSVNSRAWICRIISERQFHQTMPSIVAKT
jgi:hypothetical protein